MNGKEFIKALKNIIEEKDIDEDTVYDGGRVMVAEARGA